MLSFFQVKDDNEEANSLLTALIVVSTISMLIIIILSAALAYCACRDRRNSQEIADHYEFPPYKKGNCSDSRRLIFMKKNHSLTPNCYVADSSKAVISKFYLLRLMF